MLDPNRDPASAIVSNLSGGIYSGVGVVEIGGGICSGAAIGASLVVTAAHCAGKNRQSALFSVPFDDAPGVRVGGAIEVHPDYDTQMQPFEQRHVPDVAVIKLDERLPPSVTTYSIAGFAAPPKGQAVELVGFGQTGAGSSGAIEGTQSYDTKRFGLNDADLFSDDATKFFMDFDGGRTLASGDPTGPGSTSSGENLLGTAGTGVLEVAPGPGDSGGPVFYNPATALGVALERAGVDGEPSLAGDMRFLLGVTSSTTTGDDGKVATFGSTSAYSYLPAVANWLASHGDDVKISSLVALLSGGENGVLYYGQTGSGSGEGPVPIPPPAAIILLLSALGAIGAARLGARRRLVVKAP